MPEILQAVKAVSTHGIVQTDLNQERKLAVIHRIQEQIELIVGIKLVFRALLAREKQQAMNNQMMMELQELREKEQAEIDQINAYYQDELVKR